MRSMQYDPKPSDDEIAAALAAVRCYIERRAIDDPVALSDAMAPPARPWSIAAALAAQGLPPTRGGAHRAWGTADRAARASRWSYGITGM
jgi:hypothetical protein